MKITIVQAVKAGYSTKPTIYRDIKRGKLSASENKKGAKVIDVADLVKQYGEPSAKSQAPAPKPTADMKALKIENEMLKAELERARRDADQARNAVDEERSDSRKERERLYGLVETSQKQIEDLRETGKKGLLARLFS
jgi:hypothetical protein